MEKIFETIFNSVNDGILIFNFEGRFLEVNQITCEDLGYQKDELLQMTGMDIIPPELGKKFSEQMFEKLSKGGGIVETMGRCKDGSLVPIELNVRPIEYKGNPAILAVVRNITERKKAEEAMFKSKLAAEAANQAKSEFLTNMSHELRTPLNSIIGFSDILCSEDFGALNEIQKRYLYNVNKSGKHLLELINDMLDLSKIEAGKMELFPEEFVVLDAINGVKAIMVPLAKKKDIDLKCTIGMEDHIITADLLKFKQILYNLVSNAIKFTDEGGSVTIGSNRTDEQYSVFVQDTGLGISPGDQEKLFDPFSQVDSSLSKEYGGTGLGLALTKYFVEMHGGEIWVNSEVGKGSTFGFSIPTNFENISS
ncbi:sensor histidine kinase [Methanococcoides methylutens]|uniref:sensor histidine kinase n=1 Tax=Methanococcoides methylutens TaxID=2226 RepID=UPI0040445A68